jgi:signal transduction histidine kinase
MLNQERRYQVFVSSTFRDLEGARQEVSKALLECQCFPAGMELFPAANIEQFEYIKSIIDQCDYYVLISAGKYGSLHTGTGISFTEMEYDYAVSIGIPIIRLVHKDPFRLLDDHLVEADEQKLTLLKNFRAKVEASHVVKHWASTEELGKHVVLGLLEAQRSSPRTGWVRGIDIGNQSGRIRAAQDLQTTVMNIVREVIGESSESEGPSAGEAVALLAKGLGNEMNDLLTALSGHCDLLLLKHGKESADYSDLVQIHQLSNRMASLVGQLLAYSRQQVFKLEMVNIAELVTDLVHLLSRLIGERNVLEISHTPNLPLVMCDKRHIDQVIMNLVVNARDSMSNGGRIGVFLGKVEFDHDTSVSKVRVRAGSYVKISVSDTGKGIPEEDYEKIFLPFYSTKKTGEGVGLGLATAQGIARQHNGYIFVESSIMHLGTTISVLLPIV